MSVATYFDYTLNTYSYIMDERYYNVGATFQLGTVKRGFSEVDFAIQDGDSNGTFLILDTDYEFINKDQYYTDQEGENIWTGIRILNSDYQTGDIFVSYRCYGSFFNKAAITNLQTQITNNAGDITTLQSNPSLPAGYIAGLQISNDTDTEHDINIAVGRAKDSTGAVDLIGTVEMTKKLNAGWAAGDDAGGLDADSVANASWYYVFIIMKDSDSSIDYLFSLNKTSPTMPGGYTYFRRIRGAALTDGSANIIQFTQKDDHFWYNAIIEDVSDTTSTTRQVATISVPSGCIGMIKSTAFDLANWYCWIQNTNFVDVAPTDVLHDMRTIGDGEVCIIHKHILAIASQIAYRPDSTSGSFTISTEGYIDPAQD